MFKAIILAAGRGSRMGDMTSLMPKCRTLFKGKELIEWQIESLNNKFIDELAIVTGYLSETFDFKVCYFENKNWQNTNMVFSLICAKNWLNKYNCIISYSDIVYSPDAVERLIKKRGDIVIAYDPHWRELWEMRFKHPLLDAETFRLEKDNLIDIGNKTDNIDEIEGQYMGLFKITSDGWEKISSLVNKIDNIHSLDMTSLLKLILRNGIDIKAVPIQDNWFEVDTKSDLELYEKNFPNPIF